MSHKHTVHVTEADLRNRRKMTAGEWLSATKVYDRDGPTRVYDLPAPVRVAYVEADERTARAETLKKAPALFRLLDVIGRAKATITAVTWKTGRIGPGGLYALNHAIKTHAVRKGGLNIVRSWLENRPGSRVPFGSDFLDLLSYLEIRPIHKTSKTAPAPAEYYVYNTVRHNQRGGGRKKRPHVS